MFRTKLILGAALLFAAMGLAPLSAEAGHGFAPGGCYQPPVKCTPHGCYPYVPTYCAPYGCSPYSSQFGGFQQNVHFKSHQQHNFQQNFHQFNNNFRR